MTSPRARLAPIAVVAALVLAACSGGSTRRDPTGSAGAASDGPTTTATPQAAEATARALLVGSADVPSGWTASQPVPSPASQEQRRKLAACVGAPDPTTVTVVEVDGPELSMGQSQIDSSVTVVRSDAEYRADVAAVQSDELGPCIKRLLGPDLVAVGTGAGVTVAGFDVARTTVERHGDLTAGYRVTATIQQPGVQVGVYVDIVFLGKARNEVTVTFTGVGAPVDAAVQRQVVAKVGERIDRV